jgi:hypothetical protein
LVKSCSKLFTPAPAKAPAHPGNRLKSLAKEKDKLFFQNITLVIKKKTRSKSLQQGCSNYRCLTFGGFDGTQMEHGELILQRTPATFWVWLIGVDKD